MGPFGAENSFSDDSMVLCKDQFAAGHRHSVTYSCVT